MESQSKLGQRFSSPQRGTGIRHTDDHLNHVLVFYPSAPIYILDSICVAKGFLSRCPYLAFFGGSVFNVGGGGKWEDTDFGHSRSHDQF